MVKKFKIKKRWFVFEISNLWSRAGYSRGNYHLGVWLHAHNPVYQLGIDLIVVNFKLSIYKKDYK